MRYPQLWLSTIATTVLLTALLHAQNPAGGTPTFSSSTDLVLIPAVVSKSGSHLAGLKKEDFVLKQDGKSQPIAIFEEVKTTTTRVRRSEGEHGTFSNVEPNESVSEYHRLSIIVLDFVNTPLPDQANAQNCAG